MKIGYPCINRVVGCTSNSGFRLKNYSDKNLIDKVNNNLDCLFKILKWNVDNNIFFFRISSDLIPFASHPVCSFDWQNFFFDRFVEIGDFIKKNDIRISMHPDQFVLLNALKKDIVSRSVKELFYHCELLDLLGLDSSAKVQIHVGGVYDDKSESKKRFVDEYKNLDFKIKKRLVLENDHYMYSLSDCLDISKKVSIPILFDVFHHKCFNNGESVNSALISALNSWNKKDGVVMVDYSSQKKNARLGSHADSIDLNDFKNFLKEINGLDCDVMLEIKDKEKSALKALRVVK